MTWLALVLLGSLPSAPARQLQPKTHVSPSGGWSLRVEPLTRDGTGEADYTLTGGGSEAWKKRQPFALWDAVVTDEGGVAGYAYVGMRPEGPGGQLDVVVLSPSGEVLLDEVHEREVHVVDGSAEPWASGMFVQPELGRVVVRIVGEVWWAYDLTTGKPLFQEHLSSTLGPDPGVFCAVRPIAGTSLVLVQAVRASYRQTPRIRATTFWLLDDALRPVWNLDLAHYARSKDEESRLLDEMRRTGAVLATGPRTFELRDVEDRLRVSYAVELGADGAWKVSETGRAPYAEEESTGPALSAPFRPRLKAEVALGPASLPPSEVGEIRAFGFDWQSSLRFVRTESDGVTLVLQTQKGEVRRETHVPFPLDADERMKWFPLVSPRWLAVVRNLARESRARAWWVDEETGAREEIRGFPGSDVRRALELPDGRVLVLRNEGSDFALWTIGSDGIAPWFADHDPAHRQDLGAPLDFAIATTGEVAVLDGSQVVKVFSAEGRFLRGFQLAAAWRESPRSPCSIVTDRDGGVLIHDCEGSPALWRMRLDGSVRSRFDARAGDGQSRKEYPDALRYALDGSLWTTDGREFVRLDERGVVDLDLGPPARFDRLESPGSARIDSTYGRVLIQDGRTLAVHVFDAEGARVQLGRPSPEDRKDLRFGGTMTCDPDGAVLVGGDWSDPRCVRFAADGSSLGSAQLSGREARFLPDRSGYWCVADSVLVRVGSDGERKLEIPKRPDGDWWNSIQEFALAADGSVAVLDLQTRKNGIERGAARVVRFDAAGTSLGQIELPRGVWPFEIAAAGRWVVLDYPERGAWLLDTRDGSVRTVDLPKRTGARFGLSPAGDELWVLIPKTLRLEKYGLPD